MLGLLTPEEVRPLSALVAEKCGLQFSDQKLVSFAAKVARRMSILGVQSPQEYFLRLHSNEAYARELDELLELVANHETYFFRESGQLQAFLSTLAPDLAERARAEKRPVKLLSLGCSTGEEPYSLAILEREERTQCLDVRFEIHGADLCPKVLEKARSGVYGSSSFRSLGAFQPLLDRYFDPLPEGNFRIRESVRRSVAFHRVNVLSRFELERLGTWDAILCRNVFIYFEEAALRRALENLIACLAPGGIILLGHAESLQGRGARFTPVWLGNGMAYRVAPR